MPKMTPENRADPQFAADWMEHLCPNRSVRLLVLEQLLHSINCAQEITANAWSVTLSHSGFRLNVGAVEVMTFQTTSPWPFSDDSFALPDLWEIRLLLHGNLPVEMQEFFSEEGINEEDTQEEKEAYAFIFPSNYRSVPLPQFVYVGIEKVINGSLHQIQHEKIEKALALLAAPHAAFIWHAAHTPTGKIRKASNYHGSHSPGLYIYAQNFVRQARQSGHASTSSPIDSQATLPLPEELPADAALVEGACVTVKVNAFERNPTARRKCIAHYGIRCSVCGFSFEAQYGSAAARYIHVHHLKPLADIRQEYVIDPIADLRPVCANCHAVIHLRQPPYSIEEVQDMLKSAANS